MDSQGFIIEHGYQARAYELAAVTGAPIPDIEALRNRGVCRRHPTRGKRGRDFAALFTLYHGRAPRDVEWPAPQKAGTGYEWQQRDLEAVATLVGQLSLAEIAKVMTVRLRTMTGDRVAERSKASVQSALTRLGLQASDVVGGILLRDAAREIGSYAIVYQAIERKTLKARKVGRIFVIPYDAWAKWKASRTLAPEGWVRLSTLREPLGIKSDKLSEYARLGLVPTAIQCNAGCKGTGPSTQFGSWFIDPIQAKKLLDDRRDGRSMPWHGAYEGNIRVCFKHWTARRHPISCQECKAIWGRARAPKTYEAFRVQYPSLSLSAKRHLTKKWALGLTLYEVERLSGCSTTRVHSAVNSGALASRGTKREIRVRNVDAKAWMRRGCPSGHRPTQWLAVPTAMARYGFAEQRLLRHIRAGTLRSRIGNAGAQRGQQMVLDAACADLRRRERYTPEEAAVRLKITAAQLPSVLKDLGWRRGSKVSHGMIAAALKRLHYTDQLFSINDAAAHLKRDVAWVQQRLDEGLVHLTRPSGHSGFAGFTPPAMAKLEARARRRGRPPLERKPGDDWLLLSTAASLAGVSTTTLIRIAYPPRVKVVVTERGKLYEHQGVLAVARTFWKTVRMTRERRPAWLLAELAASTR